MLKQLIISLLLTNSLTILAQDLYSDARVKWIRNYFNDVNRITLNENPDVYNYSYCGRYINETGDTVFEGECEAREIKIFKNNKQVIKVVDRNFGGEGTDHEIKKEYYIKNDTIIFLFITSRRMNYNYDPKLGNPIYLQEERIYFKNGEEYYHLMREFEGHTSNEDELYKEEQTEIHKKDTEYYVYGLNEILDNFYKNNMTFFEEKIEKIK